MTDRERLVETVMDALPDLPLPGSNYTQGFVKHLAANEILAALEAAGYAWYRPEACEGVTVEVMNVARGTGPIDGFYAAGTYRLVPVGGEG